MGENTKIEWASHTFNPWIGCTKIAPECANCYAATQDDHRKWTPEGWGKGKPRKRTADANWNKPRQWDRAAALSGERQRVFCASLADVFDTEVDPEWRAQLFDLIEETANLDWLLLTKRPENMPRMLPREWQARPLPNVWLGTSVGHPDSKWRVGDLVNVPAAVHFLSCEPLLADLGYVELFDIEWVIVGGESGPGARPMHPQWARSLRDQCEAAGVPFFFKQWGEWLPVATPRLQTKVGDRKLVHLDGRVEPATWADVMASHGEVWGIERVGKKTAGRLLDCKEHSAFPATANASQALNTSARVSA